MGRWNQTGINGQQGFRNLPVDGRAIVLVEILRSGFLQPGNRFCYLLFLAALQGFEQALGIRNFRELGTQHQGFVDSLLVVDSIPAFGHDGADGFVSLLVGIVTGFLAVGQQGFLLCLLLVEYFQADKSFVHADGVLPVVGR